MCATFKYFDQNALSEAVEYWNTDPYEAQRRLENYVENYPQDNSGLCYYLRTLIYIGEVETARLWLKKLEQALDEEKNNPKIKQQNKIQNRVKLTMSKLSFLAHFGDDNKYEAILEICNEYGKFMANNGYRINLIAIWAAKKAGRDTSSMRDITSYEAQQLVDYSEDRLQEQLRSRSTPRNGLATFYDYFPMQGALAAVKKNIPSDNRMYSQNGWGEIYYFKYKECGTYSKKTKSDYVTGSTDYFCVIVEAGTTNIIDMYPVDGTKNLPHIDLNNLDKNYSQPKKRITSATGGSVS